MAERFDIPEVTALALATHTNPSVRRSLAGNPYISQDVITLLLQQSPEPFGTKEALLANPAVTDEQIIEILIESCNLKNRSISHLLNAKDGIDDIVKQVEEANINDYYLSVLLRNTRISSALINDLLQEKNRLATVVVCMILSRADVTNETLTIRASDSMSTILIIIAKHENASPELLTSMITRGGNPERVLESIYMNPNTPIELVASFHVPRLATYSEDVRAKLNLLADAKLIASSPEETWWEDLPLSWKLDFLSKTETKI